MAKAVQAELDKDQPNVDRAVASGYNAIWSPSNIRQRNFANFGGEFLMKQNVVGLRGFFDGFFRLPIELWGGFLAGWPGLIYNENHETWYARILYGINFIVKLPPSVAWDMFTSIVGYSVFENLALIQSVTPLLGEPESYEYKRNMDRIGDVAAKQEALRMIRESLAFAEMPTEVAELQTALKETPKATTTVAVQDAPMQEANEEVKEEEEQDEEQLITVEG